jgi:hypothetical protein
MANSIDVGPARAIVPRPTGFPPDDKSSLWFEQTNPLDSSEGILRHWVKATLSWEKLYPDDATKWFSQNIVVALNNETNFTLENIVVNPEVSIVSVTGLGFLIYGIDYTISGSSFVFLPTTAGGESFALKTGDTIQVRAMW